MTRPLVSLSLALLIAACAASTAGPPQVHWGVDECSGCHMILSSPQYAAVARSAGGEEARFDDLGCLAGWLNARRDAQEWHVWVHDADVERWHLAEKAWFAIAAGRASPMGSGITAHGSKGAAQAASPRREPLTWQEMLATGSHSHATTNAGGFP